MRRLRISLLVVLALLAGLVPLAFSGAAGAAPADDGQPASPSQPVPGDPSSVPPAAVPGTELTDLRTETTSTYATSDPNRVVTRVYSGPVHYEDDDGDWETIDTTLVSSGDGRLETRANDIELAVARSAMADQIATLRVDDQHSVGLGLAGAAKGTPTRRGDVEVLADVFPHTDLKLDATPTGFNFDFVLDSAAAPMVYELPLTLQNLTPVIDPSTGDVVFDDESGQPQVRINHGYMDDSAVNESGDGAHSEGVAYSIVTSDDGTTALRVELDANWLRDPSRVFPVVVDPNVYTALDDTYVQSPYTNDYSSDTQLKTGYCAAGTACAGSGAPAYTTRSFLHFNLSSLAGQTIQSASLLLYDYWSYNCDTSQVTNAYRVTAGSFPGMLSWGNQPTLGDLLGGAAFAYGNTCAAGWATIPLNASKVSQMANGSLPNYGIGLAAANEGTSASWRKFYSANQGGSSVPVLSITSTPATPGAPTGVSATTPGNGVVQANWSPPANAAASGVQGYTVYLWAQGATQPYGGQYCAGISCTGTNWTNVNDGTKWYLTINAWNGSAYGATATTGTVTATWKPPAPTGVTAWVGNAQAQVTWDFTNTGYGTPAPTSWVVNAYDKGTGASNVRSVTTAPPYTITGLTNGHTYAIYVAAVNSRGQGAASAPSNDVVPSTTPPPYPPTFAFTTAGNGSVWINWEKPAGNGAAAPYDSATSYVLGAYDGSTPLTQTFTVNQSTTSTHNDFLWTGLTNGHNYTFVIYPKNGAGAAAPVVPHSYTNATTATPTASPPPFPPTNITATPSNGTALVTWNLPDTRGPLATSYVLRQWDMSTNAVVDTTTAIPAAMVTGLVNGHTYQYFVRALGANGTSNWNTGNAVTPQAALGPLLNPAGVSLDQRGDHFVHVVWQTDALLALEYTAQAVNATTGAPVGQPVTVIGGHGTTGITVGNLPNGTPVKVTVTGSIVLGAIKGDPIMSSNQMTPAGKPFAPEQPTATRGDGVVTINWKPPLTRSDGTPGDNGDPITQYTVSVYNGSTLVTTVTYDPLHPPAGCVAPSGGFCQPVTGLTFGVTYTFKVRGHNAMGPGTESAGVAAKFAGHPAQMAAPVATDNEIRQAHVSWTAPDDHGDPIQFFTVTARSDGGTTIVRDHMASGDAFPGLTGGVGYTFTVTATNGFGPSVPSPASNRIVPIDVPGAPASVTPVQHDGHITVTWGDAPPRGSAVQTYTITEQPGGAHQTIPVSAQHSVDFPTTNGVKHTYSVYATNAVGNGPARTSSPIASAGQPGAVLNVRATRLTESSAIITWSRAVPNGAEVTYTVTSNQGGSITTTEDRAVLTHLSQGQHTFTVRADNGAGTTSATSNTILLVPVTPHHIDIEENDAPQYLAGCHDCFYRIYRSDKGVVIRMEYHDDEVEGRDMTGFYMKNFGTDIDNLYWDYIQQCVLGGAPSYCTAAGYIAATGDTNTDRIDDVADDDCAQHPERCDMGAVIPAEDVDGIIGAIIITAFTLLFAPEIGLPAAAEFVTLDDTALFAEGVDTAVASEFAAENGLVDLSAVMSREGLTLPAFEASDAFITAQYEQAVTELAENARGIVRVLSDDALAAGSTFADVAYPTLLENPAVAQIVQISPTTGAIEVLATNWEAAAARVATGYDGTLLWTGLGEGVDGAAVSDAYATQHGLETLNMVLNRAGIFIDASDATFFEQASVAIARNAEGTVEVLSPNAFWSQDSIFYKYEWPALQENLNVTEVLQINPETGETTVLFRR